MKKLFLKIGAIVLGAGLVVGSGAAIATHKESIKVAHAAMPSGYTLVTTSNLSTLTTSDKVVITSSDGTMGVTGYSGSDATVAASGWLEFTITNIDSANNNYSLKNADTNKWISINSSNKFTIASSNQTNMLATSDGRFSYMDAAETPAQRWLAKNGTNYRCYTNGTSGTYTYFYVYKAPAQTGSITSVTVKGPNNETGTMTVTSGYAGIPTIQLSAVVQKSGTIDDSVKWSVDNPALAEVDANGKVRLLAAGSPVITAESKADSTKKSSITIDATSLVVYPNLTDVGNFADTNVWGTTTIDGGQFSGILTNVSFADGGTQSGSTGVAYNKEGNMRVYVNTILSLSTSTAYQIEYVVFTCKSTGKLSVLPTCPNGTFSILELSGVLDCSANPSNHINITFGATSFFETMTVYYSSTGSCGVVIDALGGELTKGDSGTFTATPSGATNPVVTWSSSNSSIISVNASTGAYSVGGFGNVSITANMTCDEGNAQDVLNIAVNSGLISIADANTVCSALAADETTEYKVTLAGYIVEIKSSSFTISNEKVDGDGDTIMIYGPSNTVKNYAILNGFITYTGKLQNYKGNTNELKNLTLVSYSDDAMTYAKTSYEALDAACELGTAGVTDEAWNALAEAWTHVDSNSQVKLRGATNEYQYSDDIAHWIDRYDRIVASGKTNFMGRTYSSNLINEKTQNNNNTIIIVVVSSIALISAVSVAFVMLRKRKEQ